MTGAAVRDGSDPAGLKFISLPLETEIGFAIPFGATLEVAFGVLSGAWDNVAHRYLPAAFGAFDVRSRATLRAMTRSEASFGAQWSFREARS